MTVTNEDAATGKEDATTSARREKGAKKVKLLLDQSERSSRNLENQRTVSTAYGQTIDQKKKEAPNLRSDLDERRKLYAKDFADIIRTMMGAIVEVTIAFTAHDGFEPHVTRKAELPGTALETIKNLAFDLAAVVTSSGGRGKNPWFLIHDGRRESNMARVIYGHLFLHAVELEVASPSADKADSEYLATTITPPSEEMRKGSRWVLALVLNSRQNCKWLLKEHF